MSEAVAQKACIHSSVVAGVDCERLLAALPEVQRQVMTLFYLEERSYEEVAVMLDMPIGTVRSHLHRAKRRLAAGGGNMNRCEDFEELILRSLEAELSLEDRAVLDAHVAACPACSRFYDVQPRLDAALAAHFAGARYSPAFLREVQDQVLSRFARPRFGGIPDALNGLGIVATILVAQRLWNPGSVFWSPWVPLVAALLTALIFYPALLLRERV